MVGTDNEITSTDEGVIDLSSSLGDLKITTGELFIDLLLDYRIIHIPKAKDLDAQGQGQRHRW